MEINQEQIEKLVQERLLQRDRDKLREQVEDLRYSLDNAENETISDEADQVRTALDGVEEVLKSDAITAERLSKIRKLQQQLEDADTEIDAKVDALNEVIIGIREVNGLLSNAADKIENELEDEDKLEV